ncbi:MAG: hypothetical protein J5695_00605 [Bacteroidales bacterium]|nr:hypothetical protein [Bacteroidales bacterium]MBO4565705.1 hypothetical protein [Bacteroidales bacterium]
MTEEQLFPLDSEKIYYSMDELTLDTSEGPVTLRLGAWLNTDPVRIHQMIVKEKVLQVDNFEVLNPLVSKLRRADPEYYRRFMGLNLIIDYPGYSSGIVAKIPYENDPVGFYKWWRKGKHEDKIYLSLPNRIRLFEKVSMMDPKMILKKDLKTIQ